MSHASFQFKVLYFRVVKKSLVKEFPNGQKVGIIGYVTPITVNISHPGDTVAFTDEIVAVREEAQRLKARPKRRAR
jgi:2',3'-cyclic-nucleotide 2'-phosphodiesterase (5'-nucleotidase family)